MSVTLKKQQQVNYYNNRRYIDKKNKYIHTYTYTCMPTTGIL